LPDWVVRQLRSSSDYVTRRITANGLSKRLYAATRQDEASRPFMAHFVRLARSEAVKLQRR